MRYSVDFSFLGLDKVSLTKVSSAEAISRWLFSSARSLTRLSAVSGKGIAIAPVATAIQSCQESPPKTATSSSTAAVDWAPAELTITSPAANQPDGSAFVQVVENNPEVAQLAAKDGLGSTFSYRLQDGDDLNRFVVDESTGLLEFKDIPDWEKPQDADSNNNYMVLWQVLSSSGEARSQFLIVQVTDLPNE